MTTILRGTDGRVLTTWSAEDLARLLQEYEAWPTRANGHKALGVMKHLQTVFPARTWTSIKTQLRGFLHHGATPRKKWNYAQIQPLALTEMEIGWLAGILDGEGHICLLQLKQARHGTIAVRLTVCSNSDPAILAEVTRLVPFVRPNCTNPAGRPMANCQRYLTRRSVYALTVNNIRGAYEVLKVLRHHLRGEKRLKALAMWEYVRPRVEGAL